VDRGNIGMVYGNVLEKVLEMRGEGVRNACRAWSA
jgi:hypothetical protein